MMKERTGPKRIPWEAISQEDWGKGYAHVARLAGVTPPAARAARKKLMAGHLPRNGSHPVPEGLRPTDSPAAVARENGVSTGTARRWLAALGRPAAGRGRPGSGSAAHADPRQAAARRIKAAAGKKPTAPKNTPWDTVTPADWARGYAHVARLAGVSRESARTAHKRLASGRPAGRPKIPVPEGLSPDDSPSGVARAHGVSHVTAAGWLASIRRPPG
ncbi:MAG: hypothetical protein EOP86_20295 [Verrucomicrobiaceae bacterium]|nr:MAG: hypothetical protein EOP86_20295 [Verrucomicrobiaceae bacterium]